MTAETSVFSVRFTATISTCSRNVNRSPLDPHTLSHPHSASLERAHSITKRPNHISLQPNVCWQHAFSKNRPIDWRRGCAAKSHAALRAESPLKRRCDVPRLTSSHGTPRRMPAQASIPAAQRREKRHYDAAKQVRHSDVGCKFPLASNCTHLQLYTR